MQAGEDGKREGTLHSVGEQQFTTVSRMRLPKEGGAGRSKERPPCWIGRVLACGFRICYQRRDRRRWAGWRQIGLRLLRFRRQTKQHPLSRARRDLQLANPLGSDIKSDSRGGLLLGTIGVSDRRTSRIRGGTSQTMAGRVLVLSTYNVTTSRGRSGSGV